MLEVWQRRLSNFSDFSVSVNTFSILTTQLLLTSADSDSPGSGATASKTGASSKYWLNDHLIDGVGLLFRLRVGIGSATTASGYWPSGETITGIFSG
jgi:hypothetical protein